jgi:hypothetical protein
MTVHILYCQDFNLNTCSILGVFKSSHPFSGQELAAFRAGLEPDVPIHLRDWVRIQEDPDLKPGWEFNTKDGKIFVIEPHVVEPVDNLPPRVGRRPKVG